MRRARETPAQAAERRRRDRERKRKRRRAAVPEVPKAPETPAVPAVPVRQIDPDTLRLRPPRFLRIDPHTLMPVYEGEDPIAPRAGRGGHGWLSKCTMKPAIASCVPMSAAA